MSVERRAAVYAVQQEDLCADLPWPSTMTQVDARLLFISRYGAIAPRTVAAIRSTTASSGVAVLAAGSAPRYIAIPERSVEEFDRLGLDLAQRDPFLEDRTPSRGDGLALRRCRGGSRCFHQRISRVHDEGGIPFSSASCITCSTCPLYEQMFYHTVRAAGNSDSTGSRFGLRPRRREVGRPARDRTWDQQIMSPPLYH